MRDWVENWERMKEKGMTTPDPRIVAALAAKVLPEGWTPPMLHSWAKRLEDEKYSKSLSHLLRHIADALDGPLAEAWERSVDCAGASGFVGGRSTRRWEGDVRNEARADALRSLTAAERGAAEPEEGE